MQKSSNSISGAADHWHRERKMARRFFIGRILCQSDLLAAVFRSIPSTEANIETLLQWMTVSKEWNATISFVVVDGKWLEAFCRSSGQFVQEFRVLFAAEHADDESSDSYVDRKQTEVDDCLRDMRAHMFSEDAQYEALLMLRDTVGEGFMYECTKCIAVVNMAMRAHASVSRVQHMACAVLHILAKDEHNKDALLRTDTPSLMVRAGMRFGTACPVCPLAASALPGSDGHGSILCALTEMMSSSTARHGTHVGIMDAAVAAGAIPMAMACLQVDLDTDEHAFFQDGCCFMSFLARWHTMELVCAGAHEIIFGFLDKFPDEAALQRRGMYTLQKLVHFGDEDAIDFTASPQRFRHKETMTAVFANMLMFEQTHEKRRTQLPALRLLTTLVLGHPKTTAHLVATGLIPLVRKSMVQTLDANWSSVLVYNMVVVLRKLASNMTHRAAVAAEDVVPVVFLAMQALDNDSMLQVEGTKVLNYLSGPDSVVPPDVIKGVTLAMGVHKDFVRMQAAGARGLLCFVANRHNVGTVSKEDGVQLLVQAMDNFNGNASIVQDALSTLNILWEYGDNVARMQQAGLVQSALKAMCSHPEVLLVQSQAILALCNCVLAYPCMHAIFRHHGGAWRLKIAMELPGLDITSWQLARRILRACSQSSLGDVET